MISHNKFNVFCFFVIFCCSKVDAWKLNINTTKSEQITRWSCGRVSPEQLSPLRHPLLLLRTLSFLHHLYFSCSLSTHSSIFAVILRSSPTIAFAIILSSHYIVLSSSRCILYCYNCCILILNHNCWCLCSIDYASSIISVIVFFNSRQHNCYCYYYSRQHYCCCFLFSANSPIRLSPHIHWLFLQLLSSPFHHPLTPFYCSFCIIL